LELILVDDKFDVKMDDDVIFEIDASVTPKLDTVTFVALIFVARMLPVDAFVEETFVV
jgi:3-polyprenyl-4-hydroxybenzoate decarboxylase